MGWEAEWGRVMRHFRAVEGRRWGWWLRELMMGMGGSDVAAGSARGGGEFGPVDRVLLVGD